MSSVALALAPKPFCIFSILCSYVVLREISHPTNRASKRDRTIRICLQNLAIADCIGSTALFFTTWPMPADSPLYFQNVGTIATCSAQGLFVELGFLASNMFSVNLSVLFVLIVRYNAMESTLMNFQYWSRIFIWVTSIGFSVLYLSFGFYNPGIGYCWIMPSPPDCWMYDDQECVRGENAFWAINTDIVVGVLGPLFTQLFLFGWLFRTVYEIEDPTTRTRHSSQFSSGSRDFSSDIVGQQETSQNINESSLTISPSTVNRARSRAVAKRGLLYIGGYLLTYVLSLVELVLWFFPDSISVATPATCLLATQGIWNLLVFMRTRKMLTPEGRIIQQKLCCCFVSDDDIIARKERQRRSQFPAVDMYGRPPRDSSDTHNLAVVSASDSRIGTINSQEGLDHNKNLELASYHYQEGGTSY